MIEIFPRGSRTPRGDSDVIRIVVHDLCVRGRARDSPHRKRGEGYHAESLDPMPVSKFLWLQERIHQDEVKLHKVATTLNPADLDTPKNWTSRH
eukprot:1982881-Amphidinium_carterae.1